MGCSRLFLTACNNAPLVVLHKADASLLCGFGRMHERADGIQNAGDGLVVSAELSLNSGFELVQAPGQFLVAGYDLAQPHEGAHDFDVDGDGARTVQDGREHRHALLGECVRGIAPAATARCV